MRIINTQLLPDYSAAFPPGTLEAFYALKDVELSTPNFSFYTSVASVFSSKIEGEDIDLDSYIKHKRDGIAFMPDYTKKIDDLYDAYTFAKANELNAANIAQAHKLLSKHLVAAHYQGRYRTQNMYVATDDGRIEYVAALPLEVPEEMEKLYTDITDLLNTELSPREAFYYASMIHLVFVKVHPWSDGNGRRARLIEKWFLAQKLGEKAWYIESEKNYYRHHQTYYKNISSLGLDYPALDYLLALPFLLMLPQSVLRHS